MRKATTSDFIAKAKAVHGDKYDYSKVVYVNTNTKVIITCPIHGDFPQAPSNHVEGKGCCKCSGHHKRTTEEFIRDAKAVHGDRYGYSKTVFVRLKSEVIITCPIHGDFEQQSSNHLKGSHCRWCKGKNRLTTPEFIKKAREVHGDKFGYSKVKYVKNDTKVIITCHIHGDFSQTPINHLNGSGCPTCSGRGKKTTKGFIQKGRAVHGDKYDYSKVVYVNSKTPIIITCPIHGDFPQAPSNHWGGQGCPKCSGHNLVYLSFNEAKKIVMPLGLKTKEDYWNWWDDNKEYCQEIGLPKNPEYHYRKNK